MNFIPESELVLNSDGSIYHLNLLPEHIADTIIAVGDPERVGKISAHFDTIEVIRKKREFITHTGRVGNTRVSVISSGIGADNIDILLNELDALVNIDLKTREIKAKKRSLKIIRIGTTGSLQKDIPVDSLLVSRYGIGMDNLMNFYELPQNTFARGLTGALQDALGLPFQPYLAKGSEGLAQRFAAEMTSGITLTCPGFYAPQGRSLRIPAKWSDFISTLNAFRFEDLRLTNFEMETAGYYSLASLMGHEVVSLNAVLANRITNEFSKKPAQTEASLIQHMLERL